MRNLLFALAILCGLSANAFAQEKNKWDSVPMRSKVNIGDPFLIPIHPSDMNRISKGLALSYHQPSLKLLMFSSDIVAIGKFEGVLRYNHVPIGSGAMGQSILYAFKVERYLKADYGPVLKVRQSGGPLSWSNKSISVSGTGTQISDDPIPVLGERYIVFLRDPRRELPAFAQREYVSSKRDDPSEIHYYTDELSFSDYLQGKILLKGGKTHPLILDDMPVKWSFHSGPQLLGIPESEAIRFIQEAKTVASK